MSDHEFADGDIVLLIMYVGVGFSCTIPPGTIMEILEVDIFCDYPIKCRYSKSGRFTRFTRREIKLLERAK